MRSCLSGELLESTLRLAYGLEVGSDGRRLEDGRWHRYDQYALHVLGASHCHIQYVLRFFCRDGELFILCGVGV